MEIVIQVFIRFLHTDVFPFLGFFFLFLYQCTRYFVQITRYLQMVWIQVKLHRKNLFGGESNIKFLLPLPLQEPHHNHWNNRWDVFDILQRVSIKKDEQYISSCYQGFNYSVTASIATGILYNYLFITFCVVFTTVSTLHHSPLTGIGHMVIHKSLLHGDITVRIRTGSHPASAGL